MPCALGMDANQVFKRARHVVTEDTRTLCCAMALRRKDYSIAGSCMNDSHSSLKEDYEVRSVVCRADVRGTRFTKNDMFRTLASNPLVKALNSGLCAVVPYP